MSSWVVFYEGKKGERPISNNAFTLFWLCALRQPVRRKQQVSKQITVSWRSAGFFGAISQYSLYLRYEKNPRRDLNSITVSLHFSKSKANKSDMTTWGGVGRSHKAAVQEGGKKEQQWKKKKEQQTSTLSSRWQRQKHGDESRKIDFHASSLFFSL